jgi:hypothetical protein
MGVIDKVSRAFIGASDAFKFGEFIAGPGNSGRIAFRMPFALSDGSVIKIV